jgi:hypothetical protein
MWKASAGGSQTVARVSVCVLCNSTGRQAKGDDILPRVGGKFENKENWNVINKAIF